MIPETDRAYIAGLFDGEGSIHFKRGPEKKKRHKGKGYRISNSLRLSMEVTMTDKSVLVWLHETLGVGTLTKNHAKVNVWMVHHILCNGDGELHLEMPFTSVV